MLEREPVYFFWAAYTAEDMKFCKELVYQNFWAAYTAEDAQLNQCVGSSFFWAAYTAED